jgi:hypothetical protein
MIYTIGNVKLFVTADILKRVSGKECLGTFIHAIKKRENPSWITIK